MCSAFQGALFEMHNEEYITQIEKGYYSCLPVCSKQPGHSDLWHQQGVLTQGAAAALFLTSFFVDCRHGYMGKSQ